MYKTELAECRAGKPIGIEVARGTDTKCPTTRDTPETLRALNDLRAVVERYDHLAGRLHDRLSCVVRPSPPVEKIEKEGVGYSTALAAEINAIRCKMRDVTDGLESLYERIEL